MENISSKFDELLGLIKGTEPLYLVIGVAVMLLLILLPIILRSIKKGKAGKVKPDIVLKSFQISPLGRDAWLRLRNEGHLAVLQDVKVKKRKDILVKTNFKDVKMPSQGTTSLFLNALGEERIREDFELELLYIDSIGNHYRQKLRLEDKVMHRAKLL